MKSNVYVISCQRIANKYAVNCLETVRLQKVAVKKHIFIDDVSSDNTCEIINNYISQTENSIVEFVQNSERKYRLKNIDDAIESIDDEDGIVCLLDGDDWFSTDQATAIVQSAYSQNKKLEYVYTNWMYSHDGSLGISQRIPSQDWCAYRDPWITSAMATFKVSTYKNVPKANFLDDSGEFFKMGTDHAYVLPITHMLKKKYGDYSAVGFIDMPLYVYQFVENQMRRRTNSEEGFWETKTAADSSSFIRSRGFLDD